MTELEALEQELLKPSEALISDISKIEGDIILLGVGGKMGPYKFRASKWSDFLDVHYNYQPVLNGFQVQSLQVHKHEPQNLYQHTSTFAIKQHENAQGRVL